MGMVNAMPQSSEAAVNTTIESNQQPFAPMRRASIPAAGSMMAFETR